jgi:hypothetical protein
MEHDAATESGEDLAGASRPVDAVVVDEQVDAVGVSVPTRDHPSLHEPSPEAPFKLRLWPVSESDAGRFGGLAKSGPLSVAVSSLDDGSWKVELGSPRPDLLDR